MQTRAGADAEARRLMELAHSTGSLDLRAEAPTLRAFVNDTFKPLRGKLPAARVVLHQRGRTPSRQAVWTELHALLN